jgi:hypothetical protein
MPLDFREIFLFRHAMPYNRFSLYPQAGLEMCHVETFIITFSTDKNTYTGKHMSVKSTKTLILRKLFKFPVTTPQYATLLVPRARLAKILNELSH